MTAIAERLPGPADPAAVQTLRWMLRRPLRMLEEHHRRYGDVFRFRIYGPRYRDEGGRGLLAPRSVVVFSRPEHVQEVFDRSGDALLAGEAQQFLEWYLGPGSLMVLDGAEHRDERRELLSLFSADQLPRYEETFRRAAARTVQQWPEGAGADLRLLADRTLEAMNLEVLLGNADEAEQLLEVIRRARIALSAPVLFLPPLRFNLGGWSPGKQLAAIRRCLRDVVVQRMRRDAGTPAAHASLLDMMLARLPESSRTAAGVELLVDRLLTLVGGMDNASAAVGWTCQHLVRTPAALSRATSEVRATDGGIPGPDSYLEAVCKESLRLHPPFPVVVRRVARPVTIGGITLAPGSFVMASMYLLHRRADLFPEPDAFLPERFLGRQPKPGTYLPFGAGLRRCLGSALATRQMRTVLAEVLREFDVNSERPAALREARRNVTVVPGEPLLVTLRRTG